jgi:hypothetical protein
MLKSSMSSRDRMLAAIRREEHDHVPLSFNISQGPVLSPPFFWHNQIEQAEKLLSMGLDPTIDVWLPDPQPHSDVEIRTWREKKGQETLITKEYDTPAGVLRQVVRESQDWCDWRHGPWVPTTWGSELRDHFGVDLFDDHNVSRRTEPWVKGREDLDKLKYIIRPVDGYRLDEWRMDAARAMEYARRFDVLTQCRRTIVGDAFQWFCDIPWFLIQFYEDPEFVREFLAIFQDWSMPLVQMVLDVGVDVVQYRGWYEMPNYFGGKWWREFLYPNIEKQADLVHSAGKYLSYLLPEGHGVYSDMIRESSIDILFCLDPRRLIVGDLDSLAEAQADRKTFWGAVNSEVTLNSRDRNAIEAEVKEAIGTLNRNNGLILGSTISWQTPVESAIHMIDIWRQYRKPEKYS